MKLIENIIEIIQIKTIKGIYWTKHIDNTKKCNNSTIQYDAN